MWTLIMKTLRIVAGVVATALVMPVFYAIYPLSNANWHGAEFMFSRALQVTALPSLFVILPLFIWMQMTERRHIIWSAIGGAAAGGGTVLLNAFLKHMGQGPVWHEIANYKTLLFVIMCSLFGLISSIVGWLVAFGPKLRRNSPA
jgi:hypothetical protein